MKLTTGGQLYISTVSAAGLIVLGQCISSVLTEPIEPGWLILAGLTLLSGFFTVKVPTLRARISVSETFVFTSVLLFGTCAGTITVALDALIAALGTGKRERKPVRVLFNLAAATASIWIGSHLFYLTSGIRPLSEEAVPLQRIIGPLVLLTLAYFVINSWFVAGALAFERKENWFGIWRRNFLWLSVNYFGGASVAALLVSYTRTVDLTALGIIVPLLVISYLTFKTTLGRIEDATRHVEQLNQLYLSTIETLAMAIDAKDQVTHGHIRRVQKFTLGLAAELGLRDLHQLKALEAAALLHDTGKLVVPEHILNKPGRLTPGEFEKMKLHASAGAEILSAIQFPYPVVPIVRHHHESWDGTGYPDGLKGTQIPIGARILQVVDCFDALTSDRPYRRRLSDDEALAVLMQRRGTMYDPLIVDTFIAVKDKLEGPVTATDSKFESMLQNRTPSAEPTDVHHRIQAASAQHAALLRQVTAVFRSILESTGARLGVLYLRDYDRDELVSAVAVALEGNPTVRITMPIGARVSGWVAANGRAILNADAELDLSGELAPQQGLRRCLCIPMRHGAGIVAVAAVYMDDARGFSEHDLILVEAALATLDTNHLEGFASALKTDGSARKPSGPTVH